MSSHYFADIEPIAYKGTDSKDPLSYRWYDANRIVLGRSMADHLRIAVCYWHSFCNDGSDMFGVGTFDRDWQGAGDPLKLAEMKLDAAFEFVQKLGVPFYTFHDRDIAPEMGTLKASQKAYAHMIDKAGEAQERTGIRLLWGTANLFTHPRYMSGASTNPDPEVFACAAAQVRDALEATMKLGGKGYVLWGGREGYDTLLNTDLGQEMDHLGRFLSLVVEHKHKIGFKGNILLEPKPMEPTKHQYDHDVSTVYGFLCRYGLEREIGVNIECNHATLAGHSFEHEVATAIALGIFGSVDANRGDPQNGWDTDQFPNDVIETALALHHILQDGGFRSGGFNFDAKLRRQSIDPADLFHAHIGGIDTLARGLLIAEQMVLDQTLSVALTNRYANWNGALGRRILGGEASLASLADFAIEEDLDPKPRSGRQEALENQIGRYL